MEQAIIIKVTKKVVKVSRDYKAEYENYHGKPEQRRRRAERNKARRIMEEAGRVSPGEDVHHKDHDTSHNNLSNLEAQTPSENRADNDH